MRLKGKVAVVTGGTSGIGRRVVERFVQEGAAVLFSGRRTALGALAHIKHVSSTMRAQRQGSIINIGSVAGHRAGYSSSLVYGVAKAALIHLSRCAAMELGEDSVRVNSISPGGIATGIFGKAMGLDAAAAEATVEKIKGRLAHLQTIPRAGIPDDIASAAIFLASDESTFINGEDMVIDGGLIWGRRFSEVVAGAQALKGLFE